MYFNYFFSDPNDCLTPLSMQALPDAPESLCIAEMGGNNGIFLISFHFFVKLKSKLLYFLHSGTEGQDGEPGLQGQLYLNIGLQNGVLLRTVLDQVTGDLSDTRTRYIGSKPVKLFRVTLQKQESVLAMSSR